LQNSENWWSYRG